jgi:NADPH-dependent F420 reductase
VIIGSRDAARAQERAGELNTQLGVDVIEGMDNAAAAAAADFVVLTVPYSGLHATLESIRDQLVGKIIVDVTVPLRPPNVQTVNLPEYGSAALEVNSFVGNSARVVSAFQNVSAVKLKDPNSMVDCDVLVCSDDDEAKSEVIRLVEATGMRGIDAGPLANAVAAESLTPVLLYINKKYGIKGAGIRITGVE